MTTPFPFATSLNGQPLRTDAAFTAWNTVATFEDQDAAQRAVDRLARKGFPVEHLDIIGSDLRLVERVIGRVTKGRAVAAGAASGAWFGLLVGLLLGAFTTGPWIGAVLTAVVLGSVWGAALAFIGRSRAGASRDYASARAIVAARYDLIARNGHAEAARLQLQDAALTTAA